MYASDGTTVVGHLTIGPSGIEGSAAVKKYMSQLESWATRPSSGPTYPVNVKGQTYGSGVNATSTQGPDLIAVQATNGKSGYAYRTQLDPPLPTKLLTPKQVDTQDARAAKGYTIPVYAVNGTAVIGKFMIGGSGTRIVEFKPSPSDTVNRPSYSG